VRRLKHFDPAQNGGDDAVGASVPDEGLGIGIGFGEEALTPLSGQPLALTLAICGAAIVGKRGQLEGSGII
jgi:hypothetical protein